MSPHRLRSSLGKRGVLVFFLILCTEHSALAAVYEFTVGGTVMREVVENVNRLESFTLRYAVDSEVFSGNHERRNYIATAPTITFPRTTISIADSDRNVLAVTQAYCDYCVPRAIIGYTSWGRTLNVEMRLYFPHDTFTPEELPLALEPADAFYAKLFVYDATTLGIVPIIEGNVTSYSGVQIPEPAMFWLAVVRVIGIRAGSQKQFNRR